MSPAAGEVASDVEYECSVGICPTVDVFLGDVRIKCLLDTGSNVSTIT